MDTAKFQCPAEKGSSRKLRHKGSAGAFARLGPSCTSSQEVGFLVCESTGLSSYLSLYLSVLYLLLPPWRTFLPSPPKRQHQQKAPRLLSKHRALVRSHMRHRDQDPLQSDRP